MRTKHHYLTGMMLIQVLALLVSQSEFILEKNLASEPMNGMVRIAFGPEHAPFLTPRGEVIFGVRINANTDETRLVGYYVRRSTGNIELLFRQDQLLPGTNILGFNSIDAIKFGKNSEVFFKLKFRVPGMADDSDGLWCYDGQAFVPLVWPDRQISQYSTNARIHGLNDFESIAGASCEIMTNLRFFDSQNLVIDGPGFEPAFVRLGRSSSTTILKLSGSIPFQPTKVFDDTLPLWRANSRGDFISRIRIFDPALPSLGLQSLYLYRNQGLQLIALTGDNAIGTAGLRFKEFNSLALHDSGAYAFAGKTMDANSNPSDRLGWAESGGGLLPLYLPGQSAAEVNPGSSFAIEGVSTVNPLQAVLRLHGYLANGNLIFSAPVTRPNDSTRVDPALLALTPQGRSLLLKHDGAILDLNGAALTTSLHGLDIVRLGPQNFVSLTTRINKASENVLNAEAILSNASGEFRAITYASHSFGSSTTTRIVRPFGHSNNSTYPPSNPSFEINQAGQMLLYSIGETAAPVQQRGAFLFYSPRTNSIQKVLDPGWTLSLNSQTYELIGATPRSGFAPHSDGRTPVAAITALNGTMDQMEALFESLFILLPEVTPTICRADMDQSGTVTLQDLFNFLNFWFSLNPAADFDRNSQVSLQDLFDYLTAYFQGCPSLEASFKKYLHHRRRLP